MLLVEKWIKFVMNFGEMIDNYIKYEVISRIYKYN